MESRYAGRVVLITGAGGGLGHAMARRFAAEGAHVVACDLDAGNLDALAAAVADDPGTGTVSTSVVDVADAAMVDDWVGETMTDLAAIDVLVNNAGVIRDNRLENVTDEDWDTVIGVSLRGSFLCCRAVFPAMRRRGYGRILTFSSMSWRGNFGQTNYAAAKAGLVGLARTVALEGAPHGITSNVIAPGFIDTPMLASMNAAARTKLAAGIPMKRIGRPEDIAETAGFLCSEAAGYLTGVVLDVDGGMGIGARAH